MASEQENRIVAEVMDKWQKRKKALQGDMCAGR